MPNTKKIINFLVSFIITSTFFVSLFILTYVELYARNDIAAINTDFKKFCLGLAQPLGGIDFYMFLYNKLFPFAFLMIAISGILVLVIYLFVFLKIFVRDKKMSLRFAIFAILMFFLIPLSFFITSTLIPSSLFIVSIIATIIAIISIITVFNCLKISSYNKYKLIFFPLLVFLSYFLLFGAWINTKYSALYKCAELYLR